MTRAIFSALALVVLLAGCNLERAYPDRGRYVLGVPDLAATATVGATTRDIRVTRARLAAPFGSRSFQHRVGDDRYEADYYEGWADDPGALIAAATIDALASTGHFRNVVDDASLTTTAETLDLYVSALYVDGRSSGKPRAVLALRATLVNGDGDAGPSHEYASTVPAESGSADALVRAWNDALAAILRDLASDLATP
jgi:ABC-type uncharacterized transport system auxiliary subunit